MKDQLIWNEFGNIYLKTASYDEAIEAYAKAIDLDPNFGWPYRNLASAYLSKGRFAEAVPLLLKSIDLLHSNPEKAISFNKLGDAYRQLGDYQLALDAYQQADALSNNGHARANTPVAPPAGAMQAAPADPPVEGVPQKAVDAAEGGATVVAEDLPVIAPFMEEVELEEATQVVEVAPKSEAFAEVEEPVAESLKQEAQARPKEEVLAVESVDEPSVSESIGNSNKDNHTENPADAPVETSDFLADTKNEAAALEEVLSMVPSPSAITTGENPIGEEEEGTKESTAPFAFESPFSASCEESQSLDGYETGLATSSRFDALMGLRAKNETPIQKFDLELEEPELPEWLREPAVPCDELEEFSAFGIWEPLASEEEHPGVREQKFNFIELPGGSFLDDEGSNHEGEQLSDSGIFSDVDSEPMQASPDSEIVEASNPDDPILVEKSSPEESNAAPPTSTVSQTIEEVEDDSFEEEDQELAEAVVTTTEQNLSGSTDGTQKTAEDLQQSVSIYKKITDINPTNDRAWHTLGELYKSLNQYTDAVAAYEKAISLNPDRDIYHYHLGLVYATQKKNSEASRAFQKVLIINPEHILAHCALAGSYRRLGLEDEALEHLSIVEPMIQSETEYNRACFYAISENVDEAIRLLKIALEKKQTSLDWVQRDPDLDNLRDDPRFMATIMSQEFPEQV